MSRLNRQLKWFILAIILVGLVGYIIKSGWFNKSSAPTVASATTIQVSASFYSLYWFATQIAGDKAIVYNITPAGAEPHDYDLTTQDMKRIVDGQLLVLNGGKLEAWGDKITDTLKGSHTKVAVVGEDLASQTMLEDGETVRDPHVWLDPVFARQEVSAITTAMAAVDPSNADFYQENASALNNRLEDLNQKYIQGLSSCVKRDIITSHTAFGYLARAYKLNQVAISGLSPDAEPSPRQLATVAKFAKSNQVKYIFFESLVSPKLSQTIANEIGAQTLVLNPLEGLSDTEIASGKNYLTVMIDNLTNLKIALQCP
ncbi:MAG: zinc ABC transporter substrate-binding protein [bacterium]|nr:zinc ABC transporter substrate-binding protein [bacterium]